MPRNKLVIMSAILAITVPLCMATAVRATNKDQCTTSDNSFKVRFEGVFADESCDGDIYRYTVSSGGVSIDRLRLLEFTLERGLSATAAGAFRFVCTGAGGPGSFQYAEDIPQVCVFTAPPEVSSHPTVDICVTGAGGSVDLIGVHTQASTKSEYDEHARKVKDGTCIINGPTKGLPAFVSIVNKRIEINNVEYCIKIDPRTGCPPPYTRPFKCSDAKQTVDPDPTFAFSTNKGPFPGTHTPKIFQSTNDDPSCTTGKIVGGSPDCEWITIGGTAYGPICF